MPQHLILPLNQAQLTAGYKNAQYKTKFGFSHFGIDLSNGAGDDRTLWAMGEGTVRAAGLDSIFGNTVVITYPAVYVHRTGKIQDLTVRLYHLDSVAVKAGQPVTTATRIGVMGNTGKYTTGPHVHVEIDTDVKMPTYAPGLAGNSNIIKRGIDTTLRPSDVLYVKPTAPDKQSITFAAGTYADPTEADLPLYPEGERYLLQVGPLEADAVAEVKARLQGYTVRLCRAE